MALLILVSVAAYGIVTQPVPQTVGENETETPETPGVEAGAPLPTWSVGDNWTQRLTYPQENNRTTTLTSEVVGENSIENVDCYSVKVTTEDQADNVTNYFSKDSLTLTATLIEYATPVASPSGPIVKRTLIQRGGDEYQFPINVGDSWATVTEAKTVINYENGGVLETGWENVAQISSSVLRKENFEVPGGVFESHVIQNDIVTKSGTITQYTWFSPEAKWYVKQERYIENALVLLVELEN